MAKKSASNDELLIKLGLQGQAEWDAFLKRLEKISNEVNKITRGIKKLENVGKATTFQEMMSTPGGQDMFLAGTQFQGRRRARSTMMMGTASGQNLQNLKDELSLTNSIERVMARENALLQAKNVQLNTTAAEIKKITDLSRVSEQIEAVRVRRAQEYLAGNRQNVSILGDQLQLLRQQQKELKAGPSISPAEKLAQDRQRNMNRLFGDGGAGLLTIQAGLMTNYAALSAATSGIGASVNFAIDLDAALRNLQAITVTTEGNMGKLKETIISVSEQTKFSAVEVAEAAITLGQAGMSVKQIESAIGSVALLATATGTDLSKAVDIATSTLDVFNMEASQMGHVADVLTSAVNQSKLDIEKLTLGLQYAGNTAAQSGVTFEELTAALGAMSNAGIRSGSTLGTGMRQILISLEKPSTAFLDTLSRLGLTMEDVNVASNGIYGALKNLKDAGFTAADAIQSFEIRGAAAFTALSGNLDSMLEMEEGFLNSTAAIRANETQMRSFRNTLDNFNGVLLSVVETGIHPFLLAGRDLLQWMTDFLEQVRIAKPAIQLLTGAVVALASAFALMYPLRLAAGLATMIKGMLGLGAATAATATATKTLTGVLGFMDRASTVKGLMGATTALTTVSTTAGTASKILTGLGVAFRFMTGPIGLVITALGLGVTAWMAYNKESEKARRTVDELRTEFDNASGAMEEQQSKIEMVTTEIEHLNDRYNSLSQDSGLLATEAAKVREQFGNMGLDLQKPLTTVDALIEELQRLRTELSKEYTVRIRTVIDKLEDLSEGQGNEIDLARAQIAAQTGVFERNLFYSVNRGSGANSLKMSPEVQALLSIIRNENSDAVEVETAMLDLIDFQKANEEKKPADSREERFIELENAFIDTIVNITQDLLPRIKEKAAADAELVRQKEDEKLNNQRGQKGFVSLSGRLEALGSKNSARLDEEVSSVLAEDVSGRGRAAEAAVAQGTAELLALRRDINQYAAATGLDKTLVDELLGLVNEAEMNLITRAQPYIDAGKKESENLRQGELQRISDELQAAQSKLDSEDTDNFVEVTNIGREIFDLYMEQYQLQLDSINASDRTFNEKASDRAAAKRQLDAAVEQLRARMGGKNTEFDRAALQTQINGANILISSLKAEIDDEKDPARIDELVTEITGLITSRGELEKLLGEGQGADFIMQLTDALAKEVAAVQEEADLQKTEITDAAVEALKKQISDLQSIADMRDQQLAAQMEAANSPAQVTALAAERIANQTRLRDAFVKLVGQIEAMGVDFDDTEFSQILFSVTEAISAINEEANSRRKDLAQLAEDEAEQVRSDRLEQLKADEEAKKAAYENAKELAKEAYGQADRAAKLAAALQALSAYLKSAYERIRFEFAASAPGVLLSKIKEFMYGTAIPETKEVNAPDFGAGGGGGGKEKSELEKYTEELDARIRAYESMIKAELLSGTTGIAQVSSLVDSVKAKIAEVDGQIAAMQSAVDGGQMSEENLEQLNMLLAARKQLTDAAATAESMLTDQMIRQGDYWAAAKNISVNWAKENLDTVDAFTRGIQNVLSTMTTGFATLFTDLANGTKSAKDAFRDFALSVIKSIQNMIAEMLAMYLMQQLIGMVFPGTQKAGSFGALARSAVGLMTGGEVKRMAGGGVARDSVPAMLMPGEYVMRKSAVDMIGVDTLDAMNSRGNAVVSQSNIKGVAKEKERPPAFTNVYVVTPDQQPVPGPADIIAVINDDIARGGSTKRLIKSVSMGY